MSDRDLAIAAEVGAVREGRATAALVLGLLGLVFGVLAPFALVLGYRSLRAIQGSDEWLTGKRSALTGLLAGAVGTLVAVAGTGYWLCAAFS
jgi:hypothetical protein